MFFEGGSALQLELLLLLRQAMVEKDHRI